MDSNQYTDRKEFTLGVAVTLRQKAKRCGKPNCAHCPHEGYWYAYTPNYLTNDGKAERYLGKQWTAKDLLERVAPFLIDIWRQRFTDEIQTILHRERLAAITKELDWIEREQKRLADYAHELQEEQKAIQKQLPAGKGKKY